MADIEEEEHKAITVHVTQEEKNNLGASESMHDIMKAVESITNVWNKDKEEVFVVDRNERKIGVDKNWKNGLRITGREGRRKVEMFVWTKTLKPLCMLKQKVLKSCRHEKVWIKQKNSGM